MLYYYTKKSDWIVFLWNRSKATEQLKQQTSNQKQPTNYAKHVQRAITKCKPPKWNVRNQRPPKHSYNVSKSIISPRFFFAQHNGYIVWRTTQKCDKKLISGDNASSYHTQVHLTPNLWQFVCQEFFPR